MKDKKIIGIVAIIILIVAIGVFLTIKNDEGEVVNIYDNDIGSIDEDDEMNEENAGKISTDQDEVEDTVDFNNGQSIYLDQLDGRTKQAFVEIRNAATNGMKNIQLETIITDKDLNKIMNIMLLDMPEIVGLSNNYSYKSDNLGNVTHVKLNYFITQDIIKELNRERLAYIKDVQSSYSDGVTLKSDIISNILQGDKNPSYTDFISSRTLEAVLDKDEINVGIGTKEEFVSVVQRHVHKYNNGEFTNGGKLNYIDEIDYDSYKAVLNSNVLGIDINQLPELKNKVDILRSLGFDASVVGGEFIAYDLIPNKEKINNFKFVEADKLINETKREDGYTDVTLDPFNYYFWIVVEVDGDFYIHDPRLPELLEYYILNKLNDPLITGNEYNNSFYASSWKGFVSDEIFTLIPDNIAAGTRIMYYNESLLGMPPSCSTTKHSPIMEREEYINSTSLSDLKVESKNFIDNIIKNSDTGDVFIKIFKDSESMNAFARFIKEDSQKYNEENKNVIREYSFKELPTTNMFIVYNILR